MGVGLEHIRKRSIGARKGTRASQGGEHRCRPQSLAGLALGQDRVGMGVERIRAVGWWQVG